MKDEGIGVIGLKIGLCVLGLLVGGRTPLEGIVKSNFCSEIASWEPDEL
jgi:hypothetical protein